MRVGIAHHLGWAVVVTATREYKVMDRRRMELIDDSLPTAPIHHEGGTHPMHGSGELRDDENLAELVSLVRESAMRSATAGFDALANSLPTPITEVAIRKWPSDFPTDVSVLRRPPFESRADSVMYCHVLADAAAARGWRVVTYDARTVESEAAIRLGERAPDVLFGPQQTLGAPWTKDHRVALAATIVAV